MLSRWVGRPWFWVTVIGLLFGVPLVRTLRRTAPERLPVLGEIPAFSLPFAVGDRTGQRFEAADAGDGLKGRVWVATFIDPLDDKCDPLADRMQKLQHRLRNLGDSYRLISFVPDQVDASRAVELAARHPANPRRWFFLRLSDRTVEDAVITGMKRSGISPPGGQSLSTARVHDKHLAFLVDGRGRLRGVYDPSSDSGMDALVGDVGMLVNFE